MSADPRPVLCLDLTRLTRRVGRGPLTGIDRVELAWAKFLAEGSDPAFALVRSSLGFLLLDRRGIAALVSWASGTAIQKTRDPLWLIRVLRGHDRAAEAALARLAVARTHRLGLKRLLRAHLPAGTAYLNTGHSNLHRRVLTAFQAIGKIGILIHDTIPLDLPESQRPGVAAAFERKLRLVSELADHVFYVSRASQADAEAHLSRFGRVPTGHAAPITTEPPRPDATRLPAGLPPRGPYFVALGTIEPRKDHGLLLDVWEDLGGSGSDVPELLILGRRGWQNHEVFRRLDAIRAQKSPKVREIAGLSDEAVAALLLGARALLMPSRAEGFGLPLIEAMALGTPVVACDLNAYKETVGDYAVYLPKGERYSWRATVEAMLADPELGRHPPRAPASWAGHFNTVLSAFH